MPDVHAEKANLDPDSVAFMETLVSGERGQVGLQNGFSPNSFEGDHSVAPSGGSIKTIEAEEKAPTPPEQVCPVGLHKAVLLYPPTLIAEYFFSCFTFSAPVKCSSLAALLSNVHGYIQNLKI